MHIPERLVGLLVSGVLGTAGSASAISFTVPGDHSTIQEAVLAASSGDTVRVGPGSYREQIEMKDGVVLRSVAGPDTTILLSPGSGAGPMEEKLIVCPEGVGPGTVIEGFTLDAAGLSGTGIECEHASPTIRGNRFVGFGWAVKLISSESLIEDNVIERSQTFGLLVFASSPRIFRNTFIDNQPRAITIGGKESHPLIGGSRENSNRILRSYQAIVNGSRNDIDATWNDWGWEVAAEMEAKGYPADIYTIMDGNDAGDSGVGRGKVDYRHWIRAEPEKTSGRSRGRVGIPIALALVLIVVFVVFARR
jgi:hypothetical protein